MKRRLTYFFLLLLMMTSGIVSNVTASSGRKGKKNGAFKSVMNLNPSYQLYHISDTLSELHFQINSKELLYTREYNVDFISRMKLSYQLTSSYDSEEILDSSSVIFSDTNEKDIERFITGKVDINIQTPSNVFLHITLYDLNRNVYSKKIIRVEKINGMTRQFFITKSLSNVPLFHDYVLENEEVVIQCSKKRQDSLYVSYFDYDAVIARPAFSEQEEEEAVVYSPDSIFSIALTVNGLAQFSTNKQGMYHFQTDSCAVDGLTLFYRSEHFPAVKVAEEMLLPLRYITSYEDYEELKGSANLKKAIDEFWLNTSDDKERIRMIIKNYYRRVETSNVYFSSYAQGWKTDRGMIYQILGRPNKIIKKPTYESWIYKNEDALNDIEYTFIKIDNPFTDNEYVLERSSIFKLPWNTAVNMWRQGGAYYLEE